MELTTSECWTNLCAGCLEYWYSFFKSIIGETHEIYHR